MQFQLVENTTTINKGRKPLQIERIFPLNSEVLKRSKCATSKKTLEQSESIASSDYCLYGCPELTDDGQDGHFIYCIMPTVMSRDTTICVLSLLQRKVINRKDTEPRYEYASSLLYMKLPFCERVETFNSCDSEVDMDDRITSLNMIVKKKIVQLVKDRNQCFKDRHNEGQLMDRPVTLSRDCKAHIAMYQLVAPPYLLSVALQDEFNAVASGITCICVILYVNLTYLY
jgi:hypothetical protein